MKVIAKSSQLFVMSLVSLPLLAASPAEARVKKVHICKAPVSGIGYADRKSRAKTNAIQAWARKAKKSYGQTFTLDQARTVTKVDCQRIEGRFSMRKLQKLKRRFIDRPGEVGDPMANWNCKVSAKPCFTKIVKVEDKYPTWKKRMCNEMSERAVRQTRRNYKLGCDFRGKIWHTNLKRHYKKCLTNTIFVNFKQIRKRRKMLKRCKWSGHAFMDIKKLRKNIINRFEREDNFEKKYRAHRRDRREYRN